MEALTRIYKLYKFTFNDLSDPRSADWFPVSTPFYPLIILIIYLKFANHWGPRLMKNREPYNLKNIIAAYNISQIAINSWIFYRGILYLQKYSYNWGCQPMRFDNSPEELEVVYLTRVFFLLKTYDLLDTVFHVLRKKQAQLSFVHLYHHGGMFLISWNSVKFVPGGHGSLLGFMNSGVHTIMYTYYLVTLLFPDYKKNIWWKKHLTQLQMVQFLINFVHLGLPLVWTDCEYPRFGLWVMCPQNLFMFLLFMDFYKKAYIDKPERKTK